MGGLELELALKMVLEWERERDLVGKLPMGSGMVRFCGVAFDDFGGAGGDLDGRSDCPFRLRLEDCRTGRAVLRTNGRVRMRRATLPSRWHILGSTFRTHL
jgi:hypothetical protein